MGSDRITAYRITDYIIPSLILQNENIASNIYEDGAKFEIPDVLGEYWIGIYWEGKTIACYRVHNMGALLWQIHSRILPEHRKHSKECSITALKWCADNIRGLNKIMCFVPTVHPNVSDHAKLVGFIQEGILTDSYIKNEKIIDQEILGITKQKIKEL